MNDRPMSVQYDSHYRLATLQGPGGFTQISMTEREARAVAIALGISFSMTAFANSEN